MLFKLIPGRRYRIVHNGYDSSTLREDTDERCVFNDGCSNFSYEKKIKERRDLPLVTKHHSVGFHSLKVRNITSKTYHT